MSMTPEERVASWPPDRKLIERIKDAMRIIPRGDTGAGGQSEGPKTVPTEPARGRIYRKFLPKKARKPAIERANRAPREHLLKQAEDLAAALRSRALKLRRVSARDSAVICVSEIVAQLERAADVLEVAALSPNYPERFYVTETDAGVLQLFDSFGEFPLLTPNLQHRESLRRLCDLMNRGREV